jgi:hypothetical protein
MLKHAVLVFFCFLGGILIAENKMIAQSDLSALHSTINVK